MAAVRGRLHRADEEVGAHTVRDEGLGAVDDVATRHLARLGADRGDVGPRSGLGDPERRDLASRDRRPQEPLVLVGGAEPVHGRGRDPRVRPEPRPDPAGRARRGQLLGPDCVVDVVAALAPELHRVLQAEEAELGRPGVELARELPGRLPLVHVRRDLGPHPAVDRLAQLLVLVGERGQGRPLAGVADDGGHRACCAIMRATPSASCSRGPRSRSRVGRPSGWRDPRGGRREPRRSLPSRSRNHSVPRLRRFSPDFGSRQVIVHSITASSPSAIPCS